MPLIATISKKEVERQKKTLEILELNLGELCNKIKIEYIFQLTNYYATNDGPAMLAVAILEDGRYVVYGPEYLTKKQLIIFEFLLQDVDFDDNILVISQRDYDAIKKYLFGRNVNVQLIT